MNSTPSKIISITAHMALVHQASAERAAERVHRADSILDEAFQLALCDCEDCRMERVRFLVLEQQERRIAQQIKREWLQRAAWWGIVTVSLAAAVWAVLRG